MAKKLFYVNQSNNVTEINVPTSFIKKLYDIIKDDEIQSNLDSSSNFIGKLRTGNTYKKYIDLINEKFINLDISVTGVYILFADSNVEQILLSNFTSGGVGILATQLFHATDGFRVANTHVFRNNTNIETFDELSQLEFANVIGEGDFSGCTNLRSIDLSNVTKINATGFKNCTSLRIEYLNMPKLNSLGNEAFRAVPIIYISNVGNITTIPQYAFASNDSLISVENSAFSNIVTIDQGAFRYDHFLTSVGSLSSLQTINNYAFDQCIKLEYIDLGQNITKIGNNTFTGCVELVINDLNLPNLNTIGSNAFENTKVKKITSLGNVSSLGASTFINCNQLTTIDDNALQNIGSIGNYCFKECSSLTSVSMPNVQTIGTGAFENCTSLLSINLGTGSQITSIGSNAFYNCTSLVIEDINMSNLNSLGQYSFAKTLLKKISNISSLTTIPQYAFYNCKSLTTVSNSNNVTKLGKMAFNGCTNLVSIDLSGVTDLNAAHIFSDCTSLENINTDLHNLQIFTWDNVFTNCKLTNLDIVLSGLSNTCTENPASMFGYTKIRSLTVSSGGATSFGGRQSRGLASNPNLVFVDISQTSITTITDMSFSNCVSLRLILLPSTITSLSRALCSWSRNIEAIVLPCVTPPATPELPWWGSDENNVFGKKNTLNPNMKIYVPDESVDLYKTTEYYNEYEEMYAPLSTYVRPAGI